jgi:hypothetical protein
MQMTNAVRDLDTTKLLGLSFAIVRKDVDSKAG